MPPGVQQRPALTPAQAAHLINCSEEKLRMMLRDGEFPGVKLGRHWRVRPEAVEAYLAGELTAAVDPPPVDPQIAEILRALPPLTDQEVDDVVAIIRTARGQT